MRESRRTPLGGFFVFVAAFRRGMWLVAVLGSILVGAAGGYAQTLPTSITISPQDPTLDVGQMQQFTAQSDSGSLDFGDGTAIAAKGNHTCAVLADGTAKCWGENTDGELGDGTTMSSGTPVVVLADPTTTPPAPLTGVKLIAAGSTHTCAVKSDGTVWCWGSNTDGELGDGTQTPSSTPVEVLADPTATPPAPLTGVKSITAGADYTCALLSDGTMKCWGLNDRGQLGNDSQTSSATPVTVLRQGVSTTAPLSRVVAIAAGTNHTCALVLNYNTSTGYDDSEALCWGDNTGHKLGGSWITATHLTVAPAFPVFYGGVRLPPGQITPAWRRKAGQRGAGAPTALGNWATIARTIPPHISRSLLMRRIL